MRFSLGLDRLLVAQQPNTFLQRMVTTIGLRKLPISQKLCGWLEKVKYRISFKKYPEFSKFKAAQREHWSLFPFPTQLI